MGHIIPISCIQEEACRRLKGFKESQLLSEHIKAWFSYLCQLKEDRQARRERQTEALEACQLGSPGSAEPAVWQLQEAMQALEVRTGEYNYVAFSFCCSQNTLLTGIWP